MTAARPDTSPVYPRSPHTPTVSSLLRAELLRIWLRRFARWSVVGLLVLMALIAVIVIRNVGGPENDAVTPQSLVDAVYGAGVVVAVLGFLFGCTLGGADWSNRTMPALLFWEPRRLRLFGTKVLALAVAIFAFLAVSVAVWVAFNAYVVQRYGTWDGSGGLGSDMFVAFVRCIVLCVVAALFGFGIANLTRNTGAALGVAFVYFVIVQSTVSILLPWLGRWMFNVNVGALLTDGGLTYEDGKHTVHISPFVGGLTMVIYVVVLCGIAAELFRRRDVT